MLLDSNQHCYGAIKKAFKLLFQVFMKTMKIEENFNSRQQANVLEEIPIENNHYYLSQSGEASYQNSFQIDSNKESSFAHASSDENENSNDVNFNFNAQEQTDHSLTCSAETPNYSHSNNVLPVYSEKANELNTSQSLFSFTRTHISNLKTTKFKKKVIRRM